MRHPYRRSRLPRLLASTSRPRCSHSRMKSSSNPLLRLWGQTRKSALVAAMSAFPPDSDQTADIAGGPFRANTGIRGIIPHCPCERLHTELEFQVSKSIVTFMVRQTTVLRAGRDEDTNHFLFTRIVLSQAHVNPAVFRFARRKVSSKNGFTVLRGNDHVGGTVAGRSNSRHTLDGRAVFIVTALVWIPVMCAG